MIKYYKDDLIYSNNRNKLFINFMYRRLFNGTKKQIYTQAVFKSYS